jgi:hypothetical protein
MIADGPWTFYPYDSAHSAVIVKGASSQSANLQEWQDSSGNVKFAIEPDGDIRTAQTAAATSLGSVAAKLPIYNAAGTLVGYVPLYDAIT